MKMLTIVTRLRPLSLRGWLRTGEILMVADRFAIVGVRWSAHFWQRRSSLLCRSFIRVSSVVCGVEVDYL